MENLNTVAMFLLYSLIVSLHIVMTSCDRPCECPEIGVLKDMVQNEVLEQNLLLMEYIQKEIAEQKMESFRLHDKIRRMKAKQRPIPSSTETTQFAFAERFEKIETDVADTNVKLNMLINEQSGGNIYAEVVKRGLVSEKRERTALRTETEQQIGDIKGTVDTFKSELITSNEQCIANITATKEYLRQKIDAKLGEIERQTELKFTSVTSDLNHIEQNVLEGKTDLSALNNMVLKDKIDGGWSHWGTWSSCSVTCGNGIHDRKRTCTNPRPSLLGKQCEGNNVVVGSCGKDCPNCGFPKPISNGVLKLDSQSTTVGATASLTCNPGYKATTLSAVCKASGEWQEVECRRDCGSPKPISNGVLKLDSQSTTVGANASVTCNPGYKATTLSAICKASGEWQEVECRRDCGSPKPVSNGVLKLDSQSTTVGVTASLTCNPGYKALTLSSAICKASGEWQEIKCIQEGVIVGARVRDNWWTWWTGTVTAVHPDGRVTVSWDNGGTRSHTVGAGRYEVSLI